MMLLRMLINCIVFGRPFVKRFALCYQTVVLSVLSVLSCNAGVLWPNGWTEIDIEVGLKPCQCSPVARPLGRHVK